MYMILILPAVFRLLKFAAGRNSSLLYETKLIQLITLIRFHIWKTCREGRFTIVYRYKQPSEASFCAEVHHKPPLLINPHAGWI